MFGRSVFFSCKFWWSVLKLWILFSSVVVREDKKLLTVLFPDGRDGRAFTLKVIPLLLPFWACELEFNYHLKNSIVFYNFKMLGWDIGRLIWMEDSSGASPCTSTKCCSCYGSQWDFSEWEWFCWGVFPSMFVLIIH